MKYVVEWLPSSEQELADVWLHAIDRAAVTRAAALLDQRLREDRDTEGESRPDGRRIAFAPPLGVIFRVQPHLRKGLVSHVWAYHTK